MKHFYILLLLSLSFGTVTDIDGNVYETVQIGEQLWMAENLKVTKYKDGSEIPNITNNGEWSGLSTGAYGDYDNNPTNSETYGRLYNWYTVDDARGVCPDGWHVPSGAYDAEIMVLVNYLGGVDVVNGKMKECTEGSCPESEFWNSPNIDATNESGFTGLPAGFRSDLNGNYNYMGSSCGFWSSTSASGPYNEAWIMRLSYNYADFHHFPYYKEYGFSIRCLSDEIFESTGCTNPEACNYDETASEDDGSCEYEYDCAGTCGGDLVIDCGGVCGGDNSTALNCCGLPFNEDCTSDCYEDPNTGECCPTWEVDECGVCGGDGLPCECSGGSCSQQFDECGSVTNSCWPCCMLGGCTMVTSQAECEGGWGTYHPTKLADGFSCSEDGTGQGDPNPAPGDGTDCDNDGIPDDCEETYTFGYNAGYIDGVITGQIGSDENNDGLVDDFPLITVLGGTTVVLTQTHESNYIDDGASCFAGEMNNSQNVVVSGDVVNLSNIGTYVISYNCQDYISGNQAMTKYRTVIVQADYSDEDNDGYDDASYIAGLEEGVLIGAQSGDVNGDGELNVIDIVIFVEMVLAP